VLLNVFVYIIEARRISTEDEEKKITVIWKRIFLIKLFESQFDERNIEKRSMLWTEKKEWRIFIRVSYY
jgi:hypothetical protein